jgi:hypothetical protein
MHPATHPPQSWCGAGTRRGSAARAPLHPAAPPGTAPWAASRSPRRRAPAPVAAGRPAAAGRVWQKSEFGGAGRRGGGLSGGQGRGLAKGGRWCGGDSLLAGRVAAKSGGRGALTSMCNRPRKPQRKPAPNALLFSRFTVTAGWVAGGWMVRRRASHLSWQVAQFSSSRARLAAQEGKAAGRQPGPARSWLEAAHLKRR